MNVEAITAFISIIISFAALIISILAFRQKIPNIEIEIENEKTDCFYGATKVREEKGVLQLSSYVVIANLKIKNKSLIPINISDIWLVYDDIRYDLADFNNEYWAEIELFFANEHSFDDEKETKLITDGSYIDYKRTGLRVPFNIDAYGVKKATCVFFHFPKLDLANTKAYIFIDTAKKTFKKKVILYKYNVDFDAGERNDIEKFENSY